MELNGIVVSRETQERLDHFIALFRKWAKAINLVAPSTLEEAWKRHIADSAQIFQLQPNPAIWVDLGSGGGFPGVITAIFLAELRDGWVHLVESNNKKAAFLRQALQETGARGEVHAQRIEVASQQISKADFISARALAELDQLLDYVAPWSQTHDTLRCYFHKGRDYQREVANARGRWTFDLIEHSSRIEKDSHILEISAIRRL